MIQVGIIGATGYAGGELVRLLYGHKEAEIKWYGSRSYVDQKYASVYQNMFQIVEDVCRDDNLKQLAKEVDVIFTATPQGFLAGVLDEEILSNTKVIDLSADFRIKDVATYEKWYGIEHKSPQFIPEAVYGLCERNREAIKQARLVANPGCYPTCSITSIFPLAAEGLIDMNTLIIDAYNANPTSMQASISNFHNMKVENKMLILGDMRELGKDGPEEHQKIADFLTECGFKNVMLVGEQFAAAKHNFPTYPDAPAVIEALQKSKPHGKTILIKGSNGIKLSTVIDYL